MHLSVFHSIYFTCSRERAPKIIKNRLHKREKRQISGAHEKKRESTQQQQTWETNQIENSKKNICTIFRIIFARIANQLSSSLAWCFFSLSLFLPFQFILADLDSGEHCFAVYFYYSNCRAVCMPFFFLSHHVVVLCSITRSFHVSLSLPLPRSLALFRSVFHFKWFFWKCSAQSSRGNRCTIFFAAWYGIYLYNKTMSEWGVHPRHRTPSHVLFGVQRKNWRWLIECLDRHSRIQTDMHVISNAKLSVG